MGLARPEVRGREGGGTAVFPARSSALREHRVALMVAALVAFIVVSASANFVTGGAGLAVHIPDKLQSSEEAASALTRLFAALVLVLFLAEKEGWRMGWVAAGLVVLGLGHLTFGYVEPLLQDDPPELNESLYESLVTRTAACALFAVGLLPRRLPQRAARVAMVALVLAPIAAYLLVFELLDGETWMPPLTRVEGYEEIVQLGMSFGWLTPWHWAFSTLPLVLAVVAVAGTFRLNRSGLLRSWVLFAMILLAGSILHEYMWPTVYGLGVLSTSDLLRFGFALVVAVGGIVELRRIASERTALAAERSALLATEQERTRHLAELATLRADFSAMVAHELDRPITAIRWLNEVLGVEGKNPDIREYATAAIEKEISNLNALVADVRTAAAVERDDFEVEPEPLPLKVLLIDAKAYADSLPGDHPVRVVSGDGFETSGRVMADPQRVGQVLRNLLSNAAKYSPEGRPIELRASADGRGRARIEVADYGSGIHAEDLPLIFEKFGRGRDAQGKQVPGAGLGLYLSRRIVRAHGGELTVETRQGEGSVFGFDLPLAER
ncbi:hypothetical protein GBA65_11720 [Rubrobacter marinus]|uniref:histidine kinase n=1 Tax=Rubrobacter marinus TaxID=2653852 RepID=A0A6G8PXY4_9ACTN|nr:ATP-binding protein [Rubrobacter marinus]QIN79079.1 hypothetical protein GBA65_11720 [Rubrobacter marinus]